MRLNRSLLRKIKIFLQSKAVVLMYHRIDELTFDPWHLAVTPANFEQQLQVLQKNYTVIPLTELFANLQRGRSRSKTICITFDDGYVDNYLHAKPLLEKYSCPATFFIANKYIGNEQQYWWDELQNIILSPEKLPTSISLPINGAVFSFQLENDGKITRDEWEKQRAWYYEEPPVTHRCELYLKLWEKLKPLPYNEITEMLSEIRDWAGGERFMERNSLPMSKTQLNELTRHPLIDLGIHTMTHLSLPAHTAAEQEREIGGNKRYLETECSRKINNMAYPYGDYNEKSLEVVKKLDVDIAVTTEEKVVTRRTQPHQVGRFQVHNWNGEDFEKNLRLWMRGY
jgi:peptidoglycan/xylan/chitin deacetylase (PgdA/CDA1 family)